MALDTVPWMISGGAEHSAESGRALAFSATGGRSGVTKGGDLRARELATPGTAIRVGPGSAAIVNTYPGQTGQSYTARNTSDTIVPIAPTTGTPRSDMLVLRIDDPQYGGTPPVTIEDGPYVRFAIISNVGSTATEIPAGNFYPAIPISRIDIPAGTGTITNAMIKDLRKLANPPAGTLQVISKRWGETYDPLVHTTKTLAWSTTPMTSPGGIAVIGDDLKLYFDGICSVQITGAAADNLRYAKGLVENGTDRLLAYCYGANNAGVQSEWVTMDVILSGWVKSL